MGTMVDQLHAVQRASGMPRQSALDQVMGYWLANAIRAALKSAHMCSVAIAEHEDPWPNPNWGYLRSKEQ